MITYVLVLFISELIVCWRRSKALQTSHIFTKNAPMCCVSRCSSYIYIVMTGVVMVVLYATTVNFFLLLRSGDVEQNPGPSYLDGII